MQLVLVLPYISSFLILPRRETPSIVRSMARCATLSVFKWSIKKHYVSIRMSSLITYTGRKLSSFTLFPSALNNFVTKDIIAHSSQIVKDTIVKVGPTLLNGLSYSKYSKTKFPTKTEVGIIWEFDLTFCHLFRFKYCVFLSILCSSLRYLLALAKDAWNKCLFILKASFKYKNFHCLSKSN